MANDVTVVQSNRKYKTLVTDIGNAKQANAVIHGKKVNIVTAVIGDGNGAYYSPTPEQTALLREVWRGDIANKTINEKSPNMYDVRVVLDGKIGGFTVREVGLLDDEGDLIVIANTPDTPKAVLEDGILAPLTIVLHVVFTNAEVVEFVVNPSVDSVDYETLIREIQKHNEDGAAHADLLADYAKKGNPGEPGSAVVTDENGKIPVEVIPDSIKEEYKIITERDRDPSKPTYGLDTMVVLEIGPYSEETPVGVVLSGDLYAAQNVGFSGEANPDETIILKERQE